MKKILLSLKNSLERECLEEKIKETEESIKEFAEEMEDKGFWKVSKFLRKTKGILLFAYKKLKY